MHSKFQKNLLLTSFFLLILFSCNNGKKTSTFIDTRDNTTYKTLIINNKEWMVDNLRFETDSSWCYQNETENCQKYGRLYVWWKAMNACPEGWRMPSQDDWLELTTHIAGEEWHKVGGENRLYRKLIEGGESGFEANFPGLYSPQFRKFKGLGDIASFWSSTKFAFEAATCAVLDKANGEAFMINPGSRDVGHSCRCVRDLD